MMILAQHFLGKEVQSILCLPFYFPGDLTQYPASHSASLPAQPVGWWDGRDGQMDAWIGEKRAWWKNLALAKANHHPWKALPCPDDYSAAGFMCSVFCSP